MASREISPADRIRELGDISKDVTAMLRHMGEAVSALSPKYDGGSGLDARKEAFEEHAKAAVELIQAYGVRMNIQADALREAGIIAAAAPTLSATTTQQQQSQGGAGGGGSSTAASTLESDRITNSGLGNLDVGWLNSRGNKVGAEKEAELLQEAKILLEQELAKKRATTATG